MTSTETTCARCGLSDGTLLDLGTGHVCHAEPRDCIAFLRRVVDEKRRTIQDPYLAAVNADRVIELTASELRWRVAAERERERAENLTRKLDAMAMELRTAVTRIGTLYSELISVRGLLRIANDATVEAYRIAETQATPREPDLLELVWHNGPRCSVVHVFKGTKQAKADQEAALFNNTATPPNTYTVRRVYYDTPPADMPVTVASLVAQLVALGAEEQTRYHTKGRPSQKTCLYSSQWPLDPYPVRILILPDAEPTP